MAASGCSATAWFLHGTPKGVVVKYRGDGRGDRAAVAEAEKVFRRAHGAAVVGVAGAHNPGLNSHASSRCAAVK